MVNNTNKELVSYQQLDSSGRIVIPKGFRKTVHYAELAWTMSDGKVVAKQLNLVETDQV